MQAIKISIPEPCHENWQQMTPTDKGRFCKACAKEVVDFSKMTDEEMLEFFTKKAEASVCGRVMPQQLNRNIAKPVTIGQKVTWYWKYLVATFLLFAKTPAKAQPSEIGKMVAKPPVEQNCNTVRGEIAVKPIAKDTPVNEIFKGKIVDANGNVLPGASVQLKGTSRVVATDTAGIFTILINKNHAQIIEIKHEGYFTKTVTVSSKDKNIIIQLKEITYLKGRVAGVTITINEKPADIIPKVHVLDYQR